MEGREVLAGEVPAREVRTARGSSGEVQAGRVRTGEVRTASGPAHRRSTETARGAASRDDVGTGLNLAVLWGRSSGDAEIRTLESGRRLATLAVRTGGGALPEHRADAAVTSVPVTVWEPPAWLESLEREDPVIVVGRIRRRFFTTRAGTRGAKVEVEALSIARATRGALDRAWRRAAGSLDALTEVR